MRYSRQRELVLRQVQSRCDHPTADEIYMTIRENCPGLSLGTVYRNLNGLVEAGMIRRVIVPGQADRFDRALQEHDHLYCRCCGRVKDVHVDHGTILRALDTCDNMQIESYSLTLYGVCQDCAAEPRIAQ